MRWILAALAAASLALTATAHADIRIAHLWIDVELHADGTSIETRHTERTLTDAGSADRNAQWTLAFTPSLEKLDITEAYTLKPDGTRKPVDPSAIKVQLPPGASSAPMFSDIQQKIVVFPDLAAGDTQVITTRREITRPLFPGHFTESFEFERSIAFNDVRVTVTAPSDLALHTDSVEIPMEQTQAGERTRYTWQHRNTIPQREIYAVAPIDRRPRIYISTFATYDDMARAYAALAAPKEAVTPAIQAKADALTKDLATHREQAKALYDWTTRSIRYVAVYLGRGGVEPHDADTVLANGYGDCKDHVVLLAALLKAKGIESRTALINLGQSHLLSGPPTLAQLNHVITYIPELDVYLDSTSIVMPFATLPIFEYGKPIVMVGGPEPALQNLPIAPTEGNETRTETKARLSADGRIKGTTRTISTGPVSVSLRLIGHAFQGVNTQTMSEKQLTSLGQSGTGGFSVGHPEQLNPSYEIDASFTLEEQPGILEGNAFAPPLGLALLVRPGDYFLGPMQQLSMPTTEPTACFAGHQLETLSLELPPSSKLVRLPPDKTIEKPAFTYTSTWSFEGRIVTVRRELTSRITTPFCDGDMRKTTAAAMVEIRRDQKTTVALQVN